MHGKAAVVYCLEYMHTYYYYCMNLLGVSKGGRTDHDQCHLNYCTLMNIPKSINKKIYIKLCR